MNTEWTVVEESDPHSSPSSQLLQTEDNVRVSVSIVLDVVFHHYTWLQGTIKSNTSAELMEAMEEWLCLAEVTLQNTQPSTSPILMSRADLNGARSYSDASQHHMNNINGANMNLSIDDIDTPTISTIHTLPSPDTKEYENGWLFINGEVEAENAPPLDGWIFINGHDDESTSPSFRGGNVSNTSVSKKQQQQQHTPSRLEQHTHITKGNQIQNDLLSAAASSLSYPIKATYSLAGNIVESVFVIAEYSFWQVFYL